MPGRKYSAATQYRYGFNGKEEDDDLKFGALDFGSRILDSRIGKWLSLDPLQKKYPNEAHYNFVSNNPIYYLDEDGRDKICTFTVIDKNGNTQVFKIWRDKDFFIYKHVDVPGFGNDRYYKQDLNINITVDYRTNKIKYVQEAGRQYETYAFNYAIHKATENFSTGNSRSSQAGGITFTSEFPLEADGAKTDARGGSSSTVNIDVLLAVFGKMSKSGELLEFKWEELFEWIDKAKELQESMKAEYEKSPANSEEILPKVEPGKKSGQRLKDTVFKIYTRPGGGGTSNRQEAENEWKKFKEANPKSKKVMKSFNEKTKIESVN